MPSLFPRPHTSVPSASGELGLGWSGPGQAGLSVCVATLAPTNLPLKRYLGRLENVFLWERFSRVVATIEDPQSSVFGGYRNLGVLL